MEDEREERLDVIEDDGLDFDDDGNVLISDADGEPDGGIAAGEEDDFDFDDEPADDGEDEDKDEGKDEGKEETPAPAPEPKPAEPDERDKLIAELRQELGALKAQGKATLAKLGAKDTEDVLKGLEEVAAEADNVSPEEYRQKKEQQARDDEARRLYQRAMFEKKMKEDLDEVQKSYPETQGKTSITEIENFEAFAKFRDLGLTPVEAYAAANIASVKRSVAGAVRQESLNETKRHLQSAVPKAAKDNTIVMPKSELVRWRDVFPEKSDKEIVALYRRTLDKS